MLEIDTIERLIIGRWVEQKIGISFFFETVEEENDWGILMLTFKEEPTREYEFKIKKINGKPYLCRRENLKSEEFHFLIKAINHSELIISRDEKDMTFIKSK